ncbi:Proton-dependent oligopeptide transporter family [Macleaya cordata]|uniref:Proton-dependent oligopeptide transporter family n=1 Tax=Macleaya cordata TaxID=56857 RepID=A0A200R1J9_MACCD|nr:Proton-dependent oligopeptide transporter family [Macleaya cordata]
MEENKGGFETGYKCLNQMGLRKGGFRATMFIYVLIALENMGFVANMVSMVLYFMLVMHFDLAGSANTLTNFLGTTYLLSLIGGFISDTYLTRINTGLIFGLVEILALTMVTIQAHFSELQPEACNKSSCVRGGKAVMFYSSLFLLALGAGGMRGSVPALGGDQFNQNDPKERKALASFFNWLLLSTTLGASIGVTFIVWVSMNRGWDLGFFIATIAAFVGFVFLALGKPYYRIQAPGDSPLLRVIQVMVVAFRNRSLEVPKNTEELYEISEETTTTSSTDEEKISHTDQFRFLDKAAILQQGVSTVEPWRVCTVTQVEQVKILTRMLPIIASTILVNTCLAQLQTFSVQQGNLMDLHLGPSFKIPAASIPVIPLLFLTILIPIYEFFFVPFARKITKHPSGITQLQRVGVGLALSAISMGVAGIVEVKRRNQAMKDPTKPISLFWLSFQYAIFGIADMFTLVGMLEFFYKEAPLGMRSLSTSFTWLAQSIGYFLSSVFVELINTITKRATKSKQGWLEGQDLNKSNLNLFYWFLAILSFLNFANYLFWASWYKYKAASDHHNEVVDSDIDIHDNPAFELKATEKILINGSPFLISSSHGDQTMTPQEVGSAKPN